MLFDPARRVIVNLSTSWKKFFAIVFDLSASFFCSWFSFLLCLGEWDFLYRNQLVVFMLSVALSIPLFIKFGLYRAIIRFSGPAALRTLVNIFIIYFIVFFILFSGNGFDGIPRSIGVIQPLLFFYSVGFSRFIVRNGLMQISRQSTSRILPKALIYGAGEAGRQLSSALHRSGELVLCGFIDDDEAISGRVIDGLRIYSSSDLKRLIEKFGVSDILLALPSISSVRRNEIIIGLSRYGLHVRTLPALSEYALGRSNYFHPKDLDVEDLLGREIVFPNIDLLSRNINDKVILVSGAGGSIGGELCRKIILLKPSKLILFDVSEAALYSIYEELKITLNDSHIGYSEGVLIPVLGSLLNYQFIDDLFCKHNPATVFHAAAYKHVPLVEENSAQSVLNNVLGTFNIALVSQKYDVCSFMQISTDKAVRPTNVMGASKRVSELILQALNQDSKVKNLNTCFSMVRFGNVLGSSGSVTPLFMKQIHAGGPITLTHKDVTRYFMTIPEAAELVIQASSLAIGGEVFMLDMGSPVRIYDLAVKMIQLSGLSVKDDRNPMGDIEIKVTGLRPGEKLYEELLIGGNPQGTIHPKILKAAEEYFLWEVLEPKLNELYHACNMGDLDGISRCLIGLVPGYIPHEFS